MAWFSRKKEEPQFVRRKIKKRIVAKRSGFVAAVTNRLKDGWTGTSVDADQLVFDNLKTLRARSRDAFCNNAYARRYVQIFTSNVVGKNGFKLQSKVTGFDDRPDILARKAIEEAWKDFTENREHIDYRGMCNMKSILDENSWSVTIDGEIFVRIHEGGKYGIQIEIIDTELIDVLYHGYVKGSNNVIRSGIEYNDRNEPIAYHVSVPDKSSTSYYGRYTYGKQEYDRVPKEEMFHLFDKNIVGLSRGIPSMAPVLEDMLHMNKFQNATLVNARATACKMGFFRDPDGTGTPYVGDDEDENGVQIADFEAGGFEDIGTKEFVPFDPQFPADQYEKFMTQSLRTIASGLGVNYNDLANNLSDVNYSSIRHGAIEAREFWLSKQRMFVDEFLTPLFRIWLAKQYELKTIGIAPKGQVEPKPLSRGLDWYMPHQFVGRAFDWIDPQKDISAKEKELDLHMTSLSEVIRSRGKDPDDVFAEIAEEKQKLEQLGITATEAMQSLSNPQAPEPAKAVTDEEPESETPTEQTTPDSSASLVSIDVSQEDPEKLGRLHISEMICESTPEQLSQVLSLIQTWDVPDPIGSEFEEHSLADGIDSIRDMIEAVQQATPEQLNELLVLLAGFQGAEEPETSTNE